MAWPQGRVGYGNGGMACELQVRMLVPVSCAVAMP
jgi:hypothetical protein